METDMPPPGNQTTPPQTPPGAGRSTLSRSPVSTPDLAALPRLNTQVTPKSILAQQRASHVFNKRISTLSAASAHVPGDRPGSDVFPMFHTSLEYALVRDFAYPSENAMHYGPPPEGFSAVTTPASEVSRRMSDPVVHRLVPTVEEDDDGSYFQLPRRTFGDSPEDARYLGSPPIHRRGRSNVVDYGSGRDFDDDDDDRANQILYPDTSARFYPQSTSVPDEYEQSTPELQNIDSPSQSPYSDAYDDDEYSAMTSPDEAYPGRAIALFDFERENDNELPFSEGQVLWVNYRHGEGWLVAQDPKTGESGLVPEEYVRMLRDIEGGLTGLKSEGYEIDSTDGIDVDTPTADEQFQPDGVTRDHPTLEESAESIKSGLMDHATPDRQATPTATSHPNITTQAK